MGSVFVVSHAPGVALRTRANELATCLKGRGHDVFVYRPQRQEPGLSLSRKIVWHLRAALPRLELTGGAEMVTFVSTPRVVRCSRMLSDLNDKMAAHLLRQLPVDVIFTAAYDGPHLRRPSGTRVVYDLVDDHAAGYQAEGKPWKARDVNTFVRRQMAEADAVSVSSRVLEDLARVQFAREAVYVPNGVDVPVIRSALKETDRVRRVGYVGGLERFVRLDLVVDAVARLRRGGDEIELVVVGDGPAARGRRWPDWVLLKGMRPPNEIPAFLYTFDVGVVPFELSPFTDAALPLKVLEYGAARRPCVSSPLKELAVQSFPWVTLVPLDVDAWAEALARAIDLPWEDAWDRAVDRFDWRSVTNLLEKVLWP